MRRAPEAKSYRWSLIHHLLDKCWNVKVFWNEKKNGRMWALNSNVRKIDMHIFVLSKLYQSKNSKSINSKPLLGSIFTIELEVLAKIFLFRFAWRLRGRWHFGGSKNCYKHHQISPNKPRRFRYICLRSSSPCPTTEWEGFSGFICHV